LNLTIGISPCPNDTFIFDAIINKKIDLKGYSFDFVFDDVEGLNKKAFDAKLDITKISYFAYSKISADYILMNSGSALGTNCGPILISKIPRDKISSDLKVGIPGYNTTANFLLGLAYPQLSNKVEMLFSDIEKKLLNDEIDLGLIIHENRFTYEEKGLIKIQDLGEYWESQTQLPLPLGGIAIKRNINQQIQKDIEALISQSIIYAFKNPESSKDFIKKHSQEMEDKVIESHIQLYVNDYSINFLYK
jgi:1,4-dihydroxy-6-naphthoate synthase